MGQSLVGGLIGGAAGAFQGFITGGPAKALALGAIGFVGGFASSYMAKQATADALSSAMGPSATEPKFGGYNVNRRGAALHHQVIYGQTKVGGVVVFDDAHCTNNEDLSRIIAYAGHEIESFEKIYLGQYELTLSGDNVTSAQQIDANGDPVGSSTTKFNNYLKIRKVTGGHTTSLNGTFSGFSSEWTSSHKLLGIAHLAIIFTYADDVWDEGLPEVTALIKGKKVYDPRTSTTAWSDNPALIVRDFLTNADYGLGEDTTNIDDDLVESSANRCDETVNVTDPDNPPATIASSRYTCNGAWTTSQPPVDVIAQLMTSCAGYLWYAQGKWRMKAGEDTTPVKTLTEDDLRSPISVTTRHSRRDNFNAVRGTFRGPSTNYQFTDYPTVTSTNFVTIDGGLESTMDLALPFTDTPYEAQRLANIALEKNRSQITITGTFGLNAFDLQVGDIVSFTNSRFGWTNERFEVVAWSFGVEDYQLQVNLVLRSITATTYDAISDVTGFESADTNLPGALGEVVVGGVNETTDVTGLSAESGVMQVKLSWSNPINNNYKETKLYQHATTTFSSASLIATVTGESFTRTYGTSQAGNTKYYWAQAFDTSDNALGALFGPISAVVQQVDTDGITNNAIETDKIQNNAVSVHNAVETAGSTTLTDLNGDDGQNRWHEILSMTVSNITTELLFNFFIHASETFGSGDSRIDVRIGRDKRTPSVGFSAHLVNGQKWDYTFVFDADNLVVSNNQTYGGAVVDTGASGDETYYLLVRSDFDGRGTKVEEASMWAAELKK
jgi:hypothetical protein